MFDEQEQLEEPMGPGEQWWDRERLAREIPALRTDRMWGGFYCPNAGRISAHEFVCAMFAFVSASLTFERATVASEIEDGVQLSDGRELHAKHVVYATNAWLKQLTGLPVRPVRGQVLHAIIPEAKRFPFGLAWNDDYQVRIP